MFMRSQCPIFFLHLSTPLFIACRFVFYFLKIGFNTHTHADARAIQAIAAIVECVFNTDVFVLLFTFCFIIIVMFGTKQAQLIDVNEIRDRPTHNSLPRNIRVVCFISHFKTQFMMKMNTFLNENSKLLFCHSSNRLEIENNFVRARINYFTTILLNYFFGIIFCWLQYLK